MTAFGAVMESFAPVGGRGGATVPPDWMQGRTVFGGVAVALANKAMRSLLPAGLPLRELQVAFVGPVASGQVDLEARLLRAGRAVTLVECAVSSAGQLGTRVLGVYGAPRPSGLAAALPVAPSPEAGATRDFPFIPGVMPECTRHMSMRLVAGTPPFSGSDRMAASILLRHNDSASPGEAHVIALADAIPSPGLSMLRRPAPSSSLTWALEFLGHDFDCPPDGWWRMDAEVTAGGEGYLHQTATLYDPGGRAVALNRQLVVVYDG